jgi:hypothetical protein
VQARLSRKRKSIKLTKRYAGKPVKCVIMSQQTVSRSDHLFISQDINKLKEEMKVKEVIKEAEAKRRGINFCFLRQVHFLEIYFFAISKTKKNLRTPKPVRPSKPRSKLTERPGLKRPREKRRFGRVKLSRLLLQLRRLLRQ